MFRREIFGPGTPAFESAPPAEFNGGRVLLAGGLSHYAGGVLVGVGTAFAVRHTSRLARLEAALPVPEKTVYINFSTQVDVNSTESLLSVLSQCADQQMEEVHLLLSTPGGAVMNGMNIYNVLRAMPFTVVTHNVGNVDSIGNVIFLAGERRYACRHTSFMFHGVSFGITQAETQDSRLLRDRISNIESDEERIGGVIAERTQLTKEHAAGFFAEAHTMDVDEAVAGGIVHEVRDVAIPLGSPVVTLVLKR